MRINGVFQGGGVKGIGLVGAISEAERRGISFYRTAGTSVGALVASFVAAGYSGYEMREMLLNVPFSSFVRKTWIHRLSFIGPGIRLLVKKGMYSGDPLEHWVKEILEKKGVRTFFDLPKHALRIVASDISNGRMLVLPDDIARYGMDPMQLSVARAVRMSCSLPFFFDPVIVRCRGNGHGIAKRMFGEPVYIVDGGILSSYPLWIFDKDSKEWPLKFPTIGFQLVGSKEPEPRPIDGPISMLQALFSTMSTAHDQRYIEKHSRFRTVKIPSDMVHSTEFDITRQKLIELYESGVSAANEFFDKWTYKGYAEDFDKWVMKSKINGILENRRDPPSSSRG